jgi:hypothetical protein
LKFIPRSRKLGAERPHQGSQTYGTNEVLQEVLKDILAEPGLKTFQWSGRTFRLGAEVNGNMLGEAGQITIALSVADAPESVEAQLAQLRTASRDKRETVFWLMALNSQIDTLVSDLHASRRMIVNTTAAGAESDNHRRGNVSAGGALRGRSTAGPGAGAGAGGSVCRARRVPRSDQNGPELGKSLDEALRQQLLAAVPVLYQKCPCGCIPQGTELRPCSRRPI